MRISYLASTFCLVLATGQASAYTSVTSGGRLTGGLLLQDTDYETATDFSVETTQLLGGYKAALSPSFSLGAGVGIVLDGELGNNRQADDGSGLRLFVDGQLEFSHWGANTLLGTFALSHDRYSFQQDVDFTMTEIKIGALLAHRISRASLHGGLEVYLFSDGSLDMGALNVDVERDNRLNIRLGGVFAVSPAVDLRADLFLLSEQTFLFAADFRL